MNSVVGIGDCAFYNCTSLSSIRFGGEIDHWHTKINKGNDWNKYVPATEVVCSNGTVKLN